MVVWLRGDKRRVCVVYCLTTRIINNVIPTTDFAKLLLIFGPEEALVIQANAGAL